MFVTSTIKRKLNTIATKNKSSSALNAIQIIMITSKRLNVLIQKKWPMLYKMWNLILNLRIRNNYSKYKGSEKKKKKKSKISNQLKKIWHLPLKKKNRNWFPKTRKILRKKFPKIMRKLKIKWEICKNKWELCKKTPKNTTNSWKIRKKKMKKISKINLESKSNRLLIIKLLKSWMKSNLKLKSKLTSLMKFKNIKIWICKILIISQTRK